MGSLGKFGTDREVEPIDLEFDYFGETVRVHPFFSALTFVDFAEAASGLDGDQFAQLASVKKMLRGLIHKDDFAGFWELAKDRGQTADDLAELMKALVEAISDRPTVRQSSSPDGLPSTGPSSAPVASSRLEAARAALAGRPDMLVGLEDTLASGTD